MSLEPIPNRLREPYATTLAAARNYASVIDFSKTVPMPDWEIKEVGKKLAQASLKYEAAAEKLLSFGTEGREHLTRLWDTEAITPTERSAPRTVTVVENRRIRQGVAAAVVLGGVLVAGTRPDISALHEARERARSGYTTEQRAKQVNSDQSNTRVESRSLAITR